MRFLGGETHNNDVKRIVTRAATHLLSISKVRSLLRIATPVHAKLVLHEKSAGRRPPAIVMNVDQGDLIFNARRGIHFPFQVWSGE